jgi:plasmid stabilization system protein ParE
MARKIIWTQSAWNDLEETAEYIAKDSIHYAAATIRQCRDAARSLIYLSERGRIVPEFNDPRIRELIVANYRLIYQLKEEAVYIVGFIHGARDLWALWSREGR